MLSERHSQLLAAYLDGELSARRRSLAEKLLRKSAEARALYEQLASDSRRLQTLPPPPPPPDLSPRVLQAIAERGLQPLPVPAAGTAAAAAGIPGWLGLTAAASVLVAISAGSFLFFRARLQESEPVAQGTPTRPTPSGMTTDQDGRATNPGPKPDKDQPPSKVIRKPLGYFQVNMARLHEQPERERLHRELRKESAYHLHLPSRDRGRVVAALMMALRERGIALHLDNPAKERLSKQDDSGDLLLFAEDIYPGELTAILAHVGSPAGGAPVELCEGSFLSVEQRQRVAGLLGVAADKLSPPPRGRAEADDPLPPLVVPIPKDQAGKQPKAGPPPQPPAPDREALILARDVPMPGPVARAFVKRRRAPRPGTLQIVVVLPRRA
jgi:hypothetical protein